MTTNVLLEFNDVAFRYPDGNAGLAGCSLAIARGSRNALIGANGAGKTTLFQHANGLLKPEQGVVRYAGHRITSYNVCYTKLLRENAVDEIVRKSCSEGRTTGRRLDLARNNFV